MLVFSCNNTIKPNNIGFKNDYQKRNIKYNMPDIEPDSFVKSQEMSETQNSNISFGHGAITKAVKTAAKKGENLSKKFAGAIKVWETKIYNYEEFSNAKDLEGHLFFED